MYFKGKKHTEEAKEKMRQATLNRKHSKETKQKLSKIMKGQRNNYKGGYWSNNIPVYDKYINELSFAEKCRRNKEDNNILEIKCAYCGNWHIPKLSNIYTRIYVLKNALGGRRLYCSDNCKHECPIYNKKKYPKNHKLISSREVQPELRQIRFKIDKHTCQKCKKHQDELDVGLHCHHIEGIRWEPIESADIDKVITYCKTCHIEVHKKEGCQTHELKCKENERI